MAPKRNRYKEMERKMTQVLLGEAAVFALYLLFAGLGVGWLKVTLAIIAILVAVLCLVYLYMTGELLRKRSFWMTVGFACVALCLLISLLLNYPSPKKSKDSGSTNPSASASICIDTQYRF